MNNEDKNLREKLEAKFDEFFSAQAILYIKV